MTADFCHAPVMRSAVIVGVLSGMALFGPLGAIAHADWRQLAPWCAAIGGSHGGWDCSYYTLPQCLETARGLGGYCAPNPRVAYAPYGRSRRSRDGYR